MAAHEVADGVYRLGTRWVNFYLVTGSEGCLLVDAGYPRYWSQLTRQLDALGRTLADTTAVLVTHHHVDHAGTAEQLRQSGT